MICPKCNTVLSISVTQGIEIDFCLQCRGVWLDRGELEKIIERSNVQYGSPIAGQDNYLHHEHGHKKHHDDHHDNRYNGYHGGHDEYGYQTRHKKGFLSDLFDF